MTFKISTKTFIYLILLTLGIGLLQVLTPILLRTFIDGVIPSKDEIAVLHVLIIIGLNEIFLVMANSFQNRELDKLEKEYTKTSREWMLQQITAFNVNPKDSEAFYRSWTQDTKRLVYKKVKNPWYRFKDLVIVVLLSFICINISFVAGFIVILIAAISFTIVAVSQDDQGKDARSLNQKSLEEKKIFDDTVKRNYSAPEEKVLAVDKLLTIMRSSNEQQFNIAYYRTKQLDINGFIKFVLMFSILGVGGHLYAAEKVSMGSLWALLITMYRINPPIQSLARWIMQSKGEVNLEERIMENLETKVIFNKPNYYNRLVKILEKYLKSSETQIVCYDEEIKIDELEECLNLWRSYNSKKDNFEILKNNPDQWIESKSYFIINDNNLTGRALYFLNKSQINKLESKKHILHELHV